MFRDVTGSTELREQLWDPESMRKVMARHSVQIKQSVASSDGKEFRYTSGCIESPIIRDLVVKILESTWPAFTDRARKYSTSEFGEPQLELTD